MILYKYKSLNGQGFINTQDIFVNNRIFLPQLKMLNDPNEGIADIAIQNAYRAWGNQLEERNRKSVHILSLSETNRSALMWAHYADSHKGICLALDFSSWQDTPNIFLRKVQYVDKPIVVEHQSMRDFSRICSHKEQSWAYEKEWRFISASDSYLAIDKDTINCIYLGARFDKSNLKWVEFWRDTYNPTIPIKQMYFVSCDYELYDETEIQGMVPRIIS